MKAEPFVMAHNLEFVGRNSYRYQVIGALKACE